MVRVIPTCQLSMQLVHRVPPYPTRFPPSSLAHAHVGARGRRAFKPARPRHAMVRRLVLGRRARGGGGHRHGLGGISDGTASGSRPQSRSPHWQPPPARRRVACPCVLCGGRRPHKMNLSAPDAPATPVAPAAAARDQPHAVRGWECGTLGPSETRPCAPALCNQFLPPVFSGLRLTDPQGPALTPIPLASLVDRNSLGRPSHSRSLPV